MKKDNGAMEEKRLMRSTTERMIAGVAGGLGEYFNMDPTLVRLIFVLLALAGGPGLILYLILWQWAQPFLRASV
jgi:phage shock protein C